MASTASHQSVLLAFYLLHCLYVSTVCGLSSRTRHNDLVLATLDSDFSADHYFSYHVGDVHRDTRSLWTRHKRAIRSVEYKVPTALREDKTGFLFSVSSAVFDARRFSLNRTSAGVDLVTVNPFTGNVSLAAGQHLDYENDAMRPLTVVVEARSVSDPFGTGN